jgi:hypothetical protein
MTPKEKDMIREKQILELTAKVDEVLKILYASDSERKRMRKERDIKEGS